MSTLSTPAELGRIGVLSFTDDAGRTHGLADHDELSQVLSVHAPGPGWSNHSR